MSARSLGRRVLLGLASLLCCAGATLGCGGEDTTLGLEEPLRVEGGQFLKGKLPGRRPLSAAELMAGKEAVAPFVTPPESASRVIQPLTAGFQVSGRASPETFSVGLAFEGAGSGYWVVPAGSPDPNNDDQLFWRAVLSFGPALKPGLNTLLIAAIDEQGRSGTQRDVELCVRSAITDNLNACDPTREPPKLVVSLAWSNDADLDLTVIGPDGSRYGHERSATENVAPEAALEADANANCAGSSTPHENVVWRNPPSKGTYLVYVNLSDPCGEANAVFTVSTHVSQRKGDEFSQLETFRTASELIAAQSSGDGIGMFVTEFQVD